MNEPGHHITVRLCPTNCYPVDRQRVREILEKLATIEPAPAEGWADGVVAEIRYHIDDGSRKASGFVWVYDNEVNEAGRIFIELEPLLKRRIEEAREKTEEMIVKMLKKGKR